MKKLILATLFCVVLEAVCAGSRIWEQTVGKDFEAGEFKSTQLTFTGTVTLGLELEKIKSPETSIWCYAQGKPNVMYFGTGTRGIIYRWENNILTEYYKTETLLVTDLVVYGDYMYASTLPEGKIFRINTVSGEGSVWCKLPASHAWAMLEKDGYLWVATGPEGTLYKISFETAKDEVALKTTEKHLLSMEKDEHNIYIGTDPSGLLIQIANDGKVSVLADLVENEIRSIACGNGKIYLGANVTKNFDNAKMIQNLVREIEQQAQQAKPINRKELLQKMMSGAVYEYQENIGIRSLLPLPKNFVNVLTAYQGGVLVGTGMDGFIYHVFSSEKNTLLCDLREDQVSSIVLVDNTLAFLGTGDTGLLYRVATPTTGIYYSSVLDATGVAKWGRIETQTQGNISIQTRSGNSQIPDAFWTTWTPIIRSKIVSPNGRYLQYRAIVEGQSSTLESLKIYYSPINRPPNIHSFKVEGPREDNTRLFSIKYEKKLKLTWKADDDDKDELIYRVYYRNVENDLFYEAPSNELLLKPNYAWDTSDLPDGYYQLQIEASDEVDNSVPCKASYFSRPILIDNQSPFFVCQKVGEKVMGRACDSFSCIAQISYRFGNSDWKILPPEDGIYDDLTENFVFTIPVDQKNAVVELRAIDSSNNIAYKLVR